MSPGLSGYIVRRVLWSIPVLFLISIIVFFMLRLAPGDPVDAILGSRYQEDQARVLKEKYGYDKPIYVQYVKYLDNLAHGDLGVSTRHRDFTASEVIWPKMWVSTQLGFLAILITFGLGIPVGIYAAMARGTFIDPLTIAFWLALDAIPVYVLATLASWFFAIKLDLVNLSYRGVWSPNMIVPIMVMALPGVAGVARFMRASVISVLGEDYIRTARAKGLKERTVVITHITRNALLPMVTVIGLTLPGIAFGSIFIETSFGIPGIARESLAAVLAPDYDVILALGLFGSALFVFANVGIDIIYGIIDPRVRVGANRGQ
ncbi:MAG: ABC transporter permease [Dehalococcoidia bacterium]|jgi:ABC-type dipeptide/oligopeptide/nickel transport system permease component